MNFTPLSALSKETCQKLGSMLNHEMILRSEKGYQRDWRGIAHLSNQMQHFDRHIRCSDNPFQKLLLFWISNNAETATIEHLELYLGEIDRWDIYDDLSEDFAQHAYNYSLLIDNETAADTVPDIAIAERYDAFLLYSDADENYALQYITQLEKERQLKIFIKNRDLLAGEMFLHDVLMSIIREKCHNMIVVFTDNFLKSPENDFLLKYAQYLQVCKSLTKIITVIHNPNIKLPETLSIYSKIGYNNSTYVYFWDRLTKSIKETNYCADNLDSTIEIKRKVQENNYVKKDVDLSGSQETMNSIETVESTNENIEQKTKTKSLQKNFRKKISFPLRKVSKILYIKQNKTCLECVEA